MASPAAMTAIMVPLFTGDNGSRFLCQRDKERRVKKKKKDNNSDRSGLIRRLLLFKNERFQIFRKRGEKNFDEFPEGDFFTKEIDKMKINHSLIL